jgi:predicted O-methyltransferase YrrM
VTIESDPERAAVAAERLAGLQNVELIVGDWRDHLPGRAPFDFLFFDAGHLDEAPEAIDLLAPGGLFLKDDLTPNRPGTDPVRELLFNHPHLVAVEILTTPQTAAVLAARRS